MQGKYLHDMAAYSVKLCIHTQSTLVKISLLSGQSHQTKFRLTIHIIAGPGDQSLCEFALHHQSS